MALPKDTKARIKTAYIESRMPITTLAAMFSVDASTISRWKQADLKQGDDWDKAQAAALLAGNELESTTQRALAKLICQIERTIDDVEHYQDTTPVIKTQCLASLVDGLHKATHASRRIMPQANKLAIAREAIKYFVQFAQLNYPQQAADLIEVIEAFGSQLPRVFKE